MLLRTLNLFILMSISLPVFLYGMPDEDLVIVYPICPFKKQELFENVVQNVIPGKVHPDNYHVTLAIVKDVKRADSQLLRNLLTSVSDIHRKNTTFTATTAKRYLVNRAPAKAPLVLTPKADEAAKLKVINVLLHNALQGYNAQTGSQYVFHADLNPQTYDPHITLANNHYIQSHGLDRDAIINTINTGLNGKVLELLHRIRPHHCPHVGKPGYRPCHPPHVGKPVYRPCHTFPRHRLRHVHHHVGHAPRRARVHPHVGYRLRQTLVRHRPWHRPRPVHGRRFRR